MFNNVWATAHGRRDLFLGGCAALLLAGCATLGRARPGGAAASPSPSPSSSPAPSPSSSPGEASLPPGVGLPPANVPGAVDPRVTQANIHSTICVRGYTASVRPPEAYTEALKRQQIAALGLPGSLSDYEEDHRVPLGVGGSPADPLNLWPEQRYGPYGANAKDGLEYRVYRDVCDGSLTLAEGRAVFLGDWWTADVPAVAGN